MRRHRRYYSGTKEARAHFDGGPHKENFGTIAMMTLSGNIKVMLYEPDHKTAVTISKSTVN